MDVELNAAVLALKAKVEADLDLDLDVNVQVAAAVRLFTRPLSAEHKLINTFHYRSTSSLLLLSRPVPPLTLPLPSTPLSVSAHRSTWRSLSTPLSRLPSLLKCQFCLARLLAMARRMDDFDALWQCSMQESMSASRMIDGGQMEGCLKLCPRKISNLCDYYVIQRLPVLTLVLRGTPNWLEPSWLVSMHALNVRMPCSLGI